MAMLIDIGVNLTNARLIDQLPNLIQEAELAGVVKQIITGTCLESSQQAYQLTQAYPQKLYSTAGCHPHDAKDFTAKHLEELKLLLKQPEVVAIGECGLDFNRNYSPQETQIAVFEAQLGLTKEINKPLFLHQRDAHQQLLNCLSNQSIDGSNIATVVHCFTDGTKQIKDYLERGLYIGITGWITDKKRGEQLREAVKYAPIDRLMIETDAPYLLPQNIRPKPKSRTNTPAHLPFVLEQLAEDLNVDINKLAEQLYNNTCRFFNFQ
jgi:TatD DNase family protein